MKKKIVIFCLCCIAIASICTFGLAKEKEIPDFCKPILDSWGATDEKELQEAILTYIEENAPIGWNEIFWGVEKPCTFQFGGTTKELIKNKRNWNLAIASSKDVDLQALVDAGILQTTRDPNPEGYWQYEQWLYPEAVQEMLPKDPLYYYRVLCYSYDSSTNEAILIICNDKAKPWRNDTFWARLILDRRSPEQVRAVDGICHNYDYERHELPELSATEDELIAHPSDWDWAFLRIDKDYDLAKLDAAGLLYDFAQDEYWANRDPIQDEQDVLEQLSEKEKEYHYNPWAVPNGVWSEDGRLIAIPYNALIYNGPNEISVFVINASSEHIDRALEYSKHIIMSYEWVTYNKFIVYSDFDTVKKLDKTYEFGHGEILKEDVTW